MSIILIDKNYTALSLNHKIVTDNFMTLKRINIARINNVTFFQNVTPVGNRKRKG